MSSHRKSSGSGKSVADFLDEEEKNFPIVDLKVVGTKDSLPDDWKRIKFTVGGKRADLNTGAGGSYLYLAVKRDMQNGAVKPITGLTLILPNRQEFNPPGYHVVHHMQKNVPADINAGTGMEKVHLCFKRSWGAALTDIQVMFVSKGEKLPQGYDRIKATPTGHIADCNSGPAGKSTPTIFVCYKRRLSNLEPLLNGDADTAVSANDNSDKPRSISDDVVARSTMRRITSDEGIAALAPADEEEEDSSVADHPTPEDETSTTDDQGEDEEVITDPAAMAEMARSRLERNGSISPGVMSDTSVNSDGNSSVEGTDETRGETPRESDGTATPETPRDAAVLIKVPAVAPKEASIRGPFTPAVVSANGAPVLPQVRRTLYPLLAACYSKDVQIAFKAVESLATLIDQGYFDADFAAGQPALAMMPPKYQWLTINLVCEAVCDAFENIHKNIIQPALEFFRRVLAKSKNGLHPLSLQQILSVCLSAYSFDVKGGKKAAEGLIKSVMRHLEHAPVGGAEEGAASAEASGGAAHSGVAQAGAAIADGVKEGESSKVDGTNMVREIVTSLADSVVDKVELTVVMESALGGCKCHASITSPSFWFDVHGSGMRLFGSYPEQNVFQLLATLCKESAGPMTIISHAGGAGGGADKYLVRDVERKVFSLDMLMLLLKEGKDRFKSSRAFGYQVRRFAVTATLANCNLAIPSVFRSILRVVSTLWRHHRRYLKIEMSVMMENVLLRILKMADSRVPQKLDVLAEMVNWCDNAHNLVEMYVNFDVDRELSQFRKKIFEDMCNVVCNIAEGNGKGESDELKMLQMQALETAVAIMRSLMDASGHAHLLLEGHMEQKTGLGGHGWELDDTDGDKLSPLKSKLGAGAEGDDGAGGTPSKIKMLGRIGRNSSVRDRKLGHESDEENLAKAMELAKTKGVKKAVDFLIREKVLSDSPKEIASFLRIHHDKLDEVDIGDYLGEGDLDAKKNLRMAYVRAISFTGMSFDASIRHYLTNCGFRLPGEAQKIERLVDVFAQCFWNDNKDSFSCADTAMILSYSTIMLNTDLHNPQVKAKQRMTKQQFISNNRGIDNGKDVQASLLTRIYDSIHANEIKIEAGKKTLQRGATAEGAMRKAERFERDMKKVVHTSVEMIRAVAQSHRHPTFYFGGDDFKMSPDLVKLMIETIWGSFYGVVETIMEKHLGDMKGVAHCLDLLRYAISCTLFLGMPKERQAYCSQLAKLKAQIDMSAAQTKNQPQRLTADERKADEAWFRMMLSDVEMFDDVTSATTHLHKNIHGLKMVVEDRQQHSQLHAVAQRISARAKLTNNPNRRFIREGDLVKKCRAKNVQYRFFLFSDQVRATVRAHHVRLLNSRSLLRFSTVALLQEGQHDRQV
jgi:brefeldin A-inhibited guanine nucleotide-exchange protein